MQKRCREIRNEFGIPVQYAYGLTARSHHMPQDLASFPISCVVRRLVCILHRCCDKAGTSRPMLTCNRLSCRHTIQRHARHTQQANTHSLPLVLGDRSCSLSATWSTASAAASDISAALLAIVFKSASWRRNEVPAATRH